MTLNSSVIWNYISKKVLQQIFSIQQEKKIKDLHNP